MQINKGRKMVMNIIALLTLVITFAIAAYLCWGKMRIKRSELCHFSGDSGHISISNPSGKYRSDHIADVQPNTFVFQSASNTANTEENEDTGSDGSTGTPNSTDDNDDYIVNTPPTIPSAPEVASPTVAEGTAVSSGNEIAEGESILLANLVSMIPTCYVAAGPTVAEDTTLSSGNKIAEEESIPPTNLPLMIPHIPDVVSSNQAIFINKSIFASSLNKKLNASGVYVYTKGRNVMFDMKSGDIACKKPLLRELYRMKYSEPLKADVSGYVSLFMLFYTHLKNDSSAIHKTFFDTDGYKYCAGLPCPDGFKSVEEFFDYLKNMLFVYDNRREYLKNDCSKIVLAFKYILIKHIWNVDKAIDRFVCPYLQIEGETNIDSSEIKKKLFRGFYTTNALSNTENSAFWIGPEHLRVYSCIFKLKIWVAHFSSKMIRVGAGESADADKYEFNMKESGVVSTSEYLKTSLATDNPYNVSNKLDMCFICVDGTHYYPMHN